MDEVNETRCHGTSDLHTLGKSHAAKVLLLSCEMPETRVLKGTKVPRAQGCSDVFSKVLVVSDITCTSMH